MKTSAVELLSSLTGQKLDKKQLTPPVIFMTAVLFLIIGVIHIDGEVSTEEKERFKIIIDSLVNQKSKFRQFIQLITKNIIQQKLYRNLNHLLLFTVGFSEAEKLLLICLGYQISMADGVMDIKEKQYLEMIGQKMEIKSNYLKNLELVFTGEKVKEEAEITEIRDLLDPTRFHNLDHIFVKVASQCLQHFPIKHHSKVTKHFQQEHTGFELFKKKHQQIENNCVQLLKLIEEGFKLKITPEFLLEEVQETLAKLKSQRFRIAVIGEFSQGKSTLLNAWLGEEIQPARAIPCSGTITVLKYGDKKRVTCYYQDGKIEEIAFTEYQEKASIDEDSALDKLTEELAHSKIKEIVLEHPDLILCKNGVEIVDSPGLNEHPNRSAITQQLIKDTDAIIFLTNASRLLTQGERELLEDLRLQVNHGNKNQPAKNIFIVVNFMDLIRKEQDREGIKKRLEKVIFGETPIITGNNRIHYISAQSALDGILENNQDQYVKSFQNFTQSVEQFLIKESGNLKINQSQKLINNLITKFRSELEQFEQIITGKLQLSKENKQQIFDCIGEATGRDVKMRLLMNPLLEETMENVSQSWNNWRQHLLERLTKKSENWTSSQEDKEKKMNDYAQKFAQDLAKDFQEYFESKIMSEYLEDYLDLLDEETNKHIEAIKNNLESLDLEIGSNLVNQFSLSIVNVKQDINLNLSLSQQDTEGGGWFGGFMGGAIVAGLLAALIPGGILINMALGGIIGSFFGGDDPKQKILEKGWEKFLESSDNIYDQVYEKIISIFDDRFETFQEIIEQAIAICEQLIEQNELVHQKSLQSSEISVNWINQKRQEIEIICNNIKSN